MSLEGRIMLFKRSDTSKNSTTTSPSAGSTGSTGCASASASAGCTSASTSGASSASSKHCHQKAKGKKQQSKTSKDKSCNSRAMAKDRLSALIKNELPEERGAASVAERLKAVLKDSPRARAEQEAELMESSVQSDGAGADAEACAEACAGARDSNEPKFYAPVVVYTVEELAQAQKDKAERIVVKGELAEKLKVALKGLRSIGAGSLNTLALCLSGAALLAPFTGGVSLGAAGTAMGTLGAALTATAIAAISAIGLALVIAVFKGYDEVKLGGGGVELVIKKHKDKK